MTPDKYFTPLAGQSLLYPGEAEAYRGQCVQSVELWLKATGTNPPIYPRACDYFTNGIPGYTKIAKGQPIKAGDIIVWGKDFPPAQGNGHIDVASADGTISDFYAWDSNWTPLKLEKIHHNGSDNNYIAGYLRKENDMPTQGNVNTVIFLGLRRKATSAELTKFSALGWGDLFTYVQEVQTSHDFIPRPPCPSGTTLDKASVVTYINAHLS